MGKYFTKSAFKQALFCPVSLYYYYDREHYANQMNEDDFLQALADGGNQVGDLAKVYYDVHADADINVLDYDKSQDITARLFKRDEVNIAEAAFRWKNCFIRADIIKKKGNQIHLIEVKAKSWNENENSFVGKNDPNRVDSKILEYVYDVAFQKYIIQKALGPGFTVKASLMMADKTVKAEADGINQYFRVVKDGDRATIVREPGADALRDSTWVLKAFDVDELCDRIIAGNTSEQMDLMGCTFTEFVDEMSRQYVNHERHFCPVSERCFKCPFYSNEKTPGMLDGKRECWTEVAGFSNEDFFRPSVGELWCGDGGQSLKKKLMKANKRFLADVSADDIRPQKTKETDKKGLSALDRRLLQIGLATGNEEILAPFKANLHDGVYLDIPGLLAEIKSGENQWKYPYHMIDFETTAVALPFYKGMKPYEQVAFQFSHHIIHEDGRIEHLGQYINDEKHFFPNFEFIKQLKVVLDKDNGTIFRYADHENTILRAIRAQLVQSNESGKEELISFIDEITHATKKEAGDGNEHVGKRDMVDLCRIVKQYYYHPDMKGSNSIKVVLPAILNSSKAIQEKYSQPIYGTVIKSENFTDSPKAWISFGPDGKVENPYKHLDTIASFLEVTPEELERFDTAHEIANESIANGGAALAAYTKLQFSDAECTKALKEALLRYCELDTMSMVFIWEYFHEMTGA
jgi:hypothetical protein